MHLPERHSTSVTCVVGLLVAACTHPVLGSTVQGSVLGPVCCRHCCMSGMGMGSRSAQDMLASSVVLHQVWAWRQHPRAPAATSFPCCAGEDSSVLGQLTSAALAPSLQASAGQLVAVESAASVTGQLAVPGDDEVPMEPEAGGDAAADSAAAAAAAAAAEAVDLTRQALACAAAAAAARDGRSSKDKDLEPQQEAAAEVQPSTSSNADNACSR